VDFEWAWCGVSILGGTSLLIVVGRGDGYSAAALRHNSSCRNYEGFVRERAVCAAAVVKGEQAWRLERSVPWEKLDRRW